MRTKSTSRVRVTKRLFQNLLDAANRKFEAECIRRQKPIPDSKEDYFGFGKKSKSDQPSLFKSLLNNDAVQNYLKKNDIASSKLNPKYLYNISLEISKLADSEDAHTVDIKYLDILVSYFNEDFAQYDLEEEVEEEARLSFKNFKDYVKNNAAISQEEKNTQLTLLEVNPGEVSDRATAYTAYYYSYREYSIKNFTVKIDYINQHDGKFPALAVGIHSQYESETDKRIYKGEAYETTTCLSLSLFNEDNRHPLTIVGYTSHVRAKNLATIFSSYQAISLRGYPISAEAILVKNEAPSEQLAHVMAYLRIQRRHFYIPPRIHNNLTRLKARNLRTEELVELVGRYRIWNFSQRGYIVQSVFTIEADFGAYLETLPRETIRNKHICVMSVSTIAGKKLCVSSHPSQGISIINYAIIDCFVEPNGLSDGVFCSIGPNKKADSIAGSLVAMKTEQPIATKRLSEDDLHLLLKEKQYLRMFRRLYQLSKTQDRQLHFFHERMAPFASYLDEE